MRFVDFTAELRDPELARIALKRLDAMHVVTSEFMDTLFKVADGTLRRRMADDEPNEWLFQSRVESASTEIVETQSLSDDEARVRLGTRRLPVWIEYTLKRELWMIDTTRVHLDEVSGLGHFLHAQNLVYPQQPEAACRRRINQLRELLGPALGGPLAADYAVMLDRDQNAA